MGHFISGLVATHSKLSEYSKSRSLHAPSKLEKDFAFLPLSDGHLDLLFPQQGDFDDTMTYLSDSLKKELASLSIESPIAYIETEYFGGEGCQGAVVFNEGTCNYGPITKENGPISEAMKLLGYQSHKTGADEFESIGLCRHRENEDWIEEAEQGACDNADKSAL